MCVCVCVCVCVCESVCVCVCNVYITWSPVPAKWMIIGLAVDELFTELGKSISNLEL